VFKRQEHSSSTGEDRKGIGSGFTVTFQTMLKGPGSCQSPPDEMGIRELEKQKSAPTSGQHTCPAV